MSRAPILPLVLVLALASGAVVLAAGAVFAASTSPTASAGANEAVIRRFYAALNTAIRTGDAIPLDTLLSPNFADHPAPADGGPALAALLRAVLALHNANPRVRIEVETVAADGHTVTVHGRLHQGGIGDAPATATIEPTAVTGRIDVFRVEGGKIAEHWGIGNEGAHCGAVVDRGIGLSVAAGSSFAAALSADAPVWTGLSQSPTPRWQIRDVVVSAAPVVANGIIYAAGWGGILSARDVATGVERWRFATDDQVYNPPIVGNGAVYVVTAVGSVYALDAATGQERWHTRAAGIVGRGLSLADGTLYLATGAAPAPVVAGGVVYAAWGRVGLIVQALDAETGVERWRLALAGRALYAIELATLHTRWRLPLDRDVDSVVIGDGEAVYVSTDGLSRVDAATGRVQWHVDGASLPRSSPAIGDGLVYLAKTDGRLRAIETETGVERWVADTGGKVVSSPVVANSVVYLGSRDGHLYAVDASSGIGCGRLALGDIAHTPAVAGGVAYVGTIDGRLSAVSVDGGS